MAWNLDGRVALITGGASGIGAELARQLSARGMRIGLIDLDAGRLEGIVPGAQTAVADVRDAHALTGAVDDLAGRLGGIDVAVANACSMSVTHATGRSGRADPLGLGGERLLHRQHSAHHAAVRQGAVEQPADSHQPAQERRVGDRA